jgi:cytochrome c-type biogenesis protein
MTGPAATLLASSVTGQIQNGPLLIALPIALAAGFLSFVSPCVLPLVPGYLSYITSMSAADIAGAAAHRERVPAGPVAAAVPAGNGHVATGQYHDGARAGPAHPPPRPPRRTVASQPGGRVLGGAGRFILGFALVFVTLGAAFGDLGGMLRTHETTLTRVFGVITILLGLSFAGAFRRLRIASTEVRFHSPRAVGLAGAPVLGMMFGLGWTPCVGPTLSAVLGLAASTGASALRGALLAFVYCLGLGVPFAVAGLAFRRSMAALAVIKRHYRLVMAVGGGLLVIIGLMEVTGLWSQVIENLQTRLPPTPSIL